MVLSGIGVSGFPQSIALEARAKCAKRRWTPFITGFILHRNKESGNRWASSARLTFLKSPMVRAKEYALAGAFEFLFLQSLVDHGHILATSKWIDDVSQD
ncbi:hypothetical protein B5K05_12280 [Rhizobium phaseoli]|nr:hypothetical protein B5K04_12240 [Rhizobium phaseoli]RDJ15022.1 hypothetical protein B5K05_12280 [Rhizobium phaseoli]